MNQKTLISTEIGSIACVVGEERAIELCARAGFDAWDFSMFVMARYDWAGGRVVDCDHPLRGKDYAAFAKRLRRVGEDCGIHCNQSHAPFPVVVPAIRDCLKRAIECTALAGGHICIIHPDNHKTAAENAEMYFELLPFAKACGVKIAAENMWNWNGAEDHASAAACSHHDDFLAHLKAVNDPYLVACLDIGHAEMRGLDTSAVQFIHALGDSLQALHLHDNDRWHDSHQLPFTGAIDFPAVMKALKDIDYQGYLTLEADTHLNGAAPDEIEGRVREMAAAANRLRDLFVQQKEG